jgi:ATP-dependent DNA ligase
LNDQTQAGGGVNLCNQNSGRTETPPGAMKRDSATPASVPGFLEPMKAKLVSIPSGDWIYEVNFDG